MVSNCKKETFDEGSNKESFVQDTPKEKVEKTQSQYSQLSPPNVIAKPVVYDNKSFYSYISLII